MPAVNRSKQLPPLNIRGGQLEWAEAMLSEIWTANKPHIGAFYDSSMNVDTQDVLQVAASLAKKAVFVKVDVQAVVELDATHNTLVLEPTHVLATRYISMSQQTNPAVDSAFRTYMSSLPQLAGYDTAQASVDAVRRRDMVMNQHQPQQIRCRRQCSR
ncbi:Aste57867_24435 [Aphanomyces stellatus]|uniref:Aste57867_24435 protein n=1 Tax=Aphanomyces stellatus TaxID=120398 RepID=A0A485LQB8_9STRA|nr:hypothetical protein As57867_024359 [Aphanomyces stellatus]VFU01075.1 Aste57867_24435 [Aphanomyces stellatus]